MIQEETDLIVADNTGAKVVKCFRVLKGSGSRYLRVGDKGVGSVQKALPEGSVKKGEVVRFVVVRQRKSKRRSDGSFLSFDTNSCVLIDEKGNPRGTRVFGPVAREVRDAGYAKICSLAQAVV
ncbi:MAG: 50S ribosomal protein L14 [Chlamydiia bacterium]